LCGRPWQWIIMDVWLEAHRSARGGVGQANHSMTRIRYA
jgi:hypothetical protein